MTCRVVDVRTAKEIDRFVRLPWTIYRDDPHWVPPLIAEEKTLLDPARHPFHRHAETALFLAVRDGRDVGRIAAAVNRAHNDFHNDTVGFFGFFESIDDREVATALLQTAEAWLRERKMTSARGPCNFSTNETCGLLVEGFDSSPAIMMTYNPRYYPELIEAGGYRKAMDLLAYEIPHDGVVRDRIERIVKRLKEGTPATVRPIDLRRFDRELEIVRRIYNNAWEKNWGFVPMTEEEFAFSARSLKAVLHPDLASIAEVDGEPAGFALALPDINPILKKLNGRLFPFGWLTFLLNRRKADVFRIVALGVVEKHRNSGIGPLFYLRFITEGLRLGFRRAEMSWMLETNEAMLRPIIAIGGKLSKRYRIYEKPLTG